MSRTRQHSQLNFWSLGNFQGWVATTYPEGDKIPGPGTVQPLVDTIVQHVPPPNNVTDAPFSMLVNMAERDQYVGKFVTGKIHSGVLNKGD